MITPRIKPSSFFPEDAADDQFVVQQRKAKLEGYVQMLAAMDELIDFAAMATAVDNVCPRAGRRKGGRPPYPTEALVRMVFLQGLYNLSDEQCEHQVLDRLSLQRLCRLDRAGNTLDARTLWSFRQRLAEGGLGGRAVFETLSQQVRASNDAGAQGAVHRDAISGLQREQIGLTDHARRRVRTACLRGKTPSRVIAAGWQVADDSRQRLVGAGIMLGPVAISAAGLVSGRNRHGIIDHDFCFFGGVNGI